MKLFSSLAAFIAVIAIAYPLYEGVASLIVPPVAGTLVAIFVALTLQKKNEQKDCDQQLFNEAMQQSTKSIIEYLANYEQRLTSQVSELAVATNEQLVDVWTITQTALTEDSKRVQKKSVQLISEIEALQKQQSQLSKTIADSLQHWLTEQSIVSKETFAAVKEAHEQLLSKSEQTHKRIEDSWDDYQKRQLEIRHKEHKHIMTIEMTVTKMINSNTAALNEKIITGWEATRSELEQLRKSENEHAVHLFQTVEQSNKDMSTTLSDQRKTFETAEAFYKDTYAQIKDYTNRLAEHETTLANHHEQLINTQQSIKETISETLNKVMESHTKVLSSSQETIANSIAELKDQRAMSQEEFENFLGEFLDSLDNQEEQSKQFTEQLQANVANLLVDSSNMLSDTIKELRRTSELHNNAMENLLAESKTIIDKNFDVLTSLNAQTEETKETAKTLEHAFKEISALNQKDMELLQRLMR